jgi:UDP-glucose 4-epimerase
MKILITGGAGFIGSHLAEAYLARGEHVYVLDDLSTGQLENIAHLEENSEYRKRFHACADSIFNKDKLLDLVGTCDVVIHLAAAVGVQYILDNPLSSIITNIQGTERVLEICNRFQKKVLIASTSEVYGDQKHAPLLETDGCVYGASTKSRWSYAASKLMDEFIALAYHRTKNLPVVIVRFFNTVGPRQTGRYGMVIPRFVKQVLSNEPLTVYGDGSQSRTFTHVNDAVEAIIRLMDIEAAIGEVVNIGGVDEITILELAEKIKARVGSHSVVEMIPYSKAFPESFEDMQRRVPSTEKLQRLTGFKPSIDLDTIIDDVIAYARTSVKI